MELMGPPWNAPGVLPDCEPCDQCNIAPSSATIVIQEESGVKLQHQQSQENHLATRGCFWHNYSCTHPAQNFKHNLR
jgi:hypothetical protein